MTKDMKALRALWREVIALALHELRALNERQSYESRSARQFFFGKSSSLPLACEVLGLNLERVRQRIAQLLVMRARAVC